MNRYMMIARRNDCIGTFHGTEAALDIANEHGLKVHTHYWKDPYTSAYGRTFFARTRHFKKLPKSVRKAILAILEQ